MTSRGSSRDSLTDRLPLGAMVPLVLAVACTTLVPEPVRTPIPRATSTFEKYLERARAGDAASQNLIGYMLFTGESAPTDRRAAHQWFQTASEQGHTIAQINLAIVNALGAGVAQDPGAAAAHFGTARANLERPVSLQLTTLPALVDASCAMPDPERGVGRDAYETFCSGCHGLNGIAEFGASPSFALGERMQVGMGELLFTIVNGHGDMPRWGDKLPHDVLEAALRYARTLADQFRLGTLHVLNPPPDHYFRFGPMSSDFGRAPTDPSLTYGGSAPPLEEFCLGMQYSRLERPHTGR